MVRLHVQTYCTVDEEVEACHVTWLGPLTYHIYHSICTEGTPEPAHSVPDKLSVSNQTSSCLDRTISNYLCTYAF